MRTWKYNKLYVEEKTTKKSDPYLSQKKKSDPYRPFDRGNTRAYWLVIVIWLHNVNVLFQQQLTSHGSARWRMLYEIYWHLSTIFSTLRSHPREKKRKHKFSNLRYHLKIIKNMMNKQVAQKIMPRQNKWLKKKTWTDVLFRIEFCH